MASVTDEGDGEVMERTGQDGTGLDYAGDCSSRAEKKEVEVVVVVG